MWGEESDDERAEPHQPEVGVLGEESDDERADPRCMGKEI